MRTTLQLGLFAILFMIFSTSFLKAQDGLDETLMVLDNLAMNYQDLDDAISVLQDHIEYSENELDSKAQEINNLNKDLKYAVEKASKYNDNLANQLDSFEAYCYTLLEEKCPSLEKAFMRLIDKVEPCIELGEEPIYALELIDGRYDEKFLMKQFKEARKESLKVASTLEKLKEEFMKLSGSCK